MTAEPIEQAAPAWPIDQAILADAQDQAFEYQPSTSGLSDSAQERAWSARLEAAMEGIGAEDPGQLNWWMNAHADSAVPHLEEAELVAQWETYVRDDVLGREAEHDGAER